MSILLEMDETVTRIRAEGELDLSVAAELKSALLKALEIPRNAVLDLEQVPGIDLPCMQVLLAALRGFGTGSYALTIKDPSGRFAAAALDCGFEGI